MRAAAVVVLFGGVGLIAIAVAWYVQVSITVGSKTAEDGSFAARLDRQVRLLIVGEPDTANALRAAILEADDADLIAEDSTPSEPDGADAILVLLNGWEDIATAPWQDRFGTDYEIVATRADDSFALSMADGDRPLLPVYYNLEHYPEWGVDCYSTLFLHEIGGTPGTSVVMPQTC